MKQFVKILRNMKCINLYKWKMSHLSKMYHELSQFSMGFQYNQGDFNSSIDQPTLALED